MVKLHMSLCLAFIISISALNLVIDPGQLYLKKLMIGQSLKAYVKTMVESEFGVVSSGPERQIKLELAGLSGAECYVIGSSRALQASLRDKSWLSNDCASLANLGVSGGSFEDLIVYLSSLLDKRNKNIIIFLDPWALSFGADIRWRENSGLYTSHMKNIGFEEETYVSFDFEKLENIVNYKYSISAIKLILAQGLDAFPVIGHDFIKKVPPFNLSSGYEKGVRLPDGSLIYSSEYISGAPEREINNGGYKLKSIKIDPKALSAFLQTLSLLEEAGHRLTIAFSPYHPHVFSGSGDPAVVKNILAVENTIIKLSQKLGITVRGGYDPTKFSCKESEFYDAIHPSFSCLAKLTERAGPETP